MVGRRLFLLEGLIFRGYVSFREGKAAGLMNGGGGVMLGGKGLGGQHLAMMNC